MNIQKLMKSTVFTIIMLIVIYPVGLILMWKNKKFNKLGRIIISAIFGIILLVGTGEEDATPNINKVVVEDNGLEDETSIGNKDTENKDTQVIDTENKDTENKDTENKDTQDIDTGNKDTENKDTQDIDAGNKDTKNNDTQVIDTGNKNTENKDSKVTSSVDTTHVEGKKKEESLLFTKNKNSIEFMNKSYKIIMVDGGNLSGHREKNVAVDIGFGDREYWGLTNEFGQLVYVFAEQIQLQNHETEDVNSNGRYYWDEAKVAGTELKEYDEGHVIADSMGGVSNAYNITPQESTLNRHGDQAYMEKVIRDAGGATNFFATITYANDNTQIPSNYRYEYTLKGEVIIDEYPNKNPDGSGDSSNVTSAPTKSPTQSPVNHTKDNDSTKSGEKTNSNASNSNASNSNASNSNASNSNASKSNASTSNTTTTTTVNETSELKKVDTNNNGKVTIAEAKAAGFTMPITSEHWLYKYMDDRDGDGKVGE